MIPRISIRKPAMQNNKPLDSFTVVLPAPALCVTLMLLAVVLLVLLVVVELLIVVWALVDLGMFEIVLVVLPNTKAVPLESILMRVPLIVTTPPGVRVVPGAMTYNVCPLDMMGVYVCPLIVSVGAAVMAPLPKVDVFPLMTMTPLVEVGKQYVVPEMVMEPPGVNVVPGPRMNDVWDPDILAVIGCPFTVRTGGAVMEGLEKPRVEV